MIELFKWAQRWGISSQAMKDLHHILGATTDPVRIPIDDKSEAAIMQQARLDATKSGGRLWRNNVGAVRTDTGSFIRFGLCNSSAKLNAKIKSSDLIGIRPVVIATKDVGATVGQFMAIECKKSQWGYTGTTNEVAQLKFIMLVQSLGGYARFSKGGGL